MEIYTAGVWGTVTDSDWTSEDAQVVCHMLGYFKPGNLANIILWPPSFKVMSQPSSLLATSYHY